MAVAGLWGVTLDCPDPDGLARFYQRLTGGEIVYADHVSTHLRVGAFTLGFQRDPAYRAPTWPDPETPQQCHVDLSTPDLDGAMTAAVLAGARLANHQPQPTVFRVLFDPAGHPFCLSNWDF
ncbi:VOC family protein [Microlunatus speluncae]|uniref:VOC family protein n=1 Tax=Microlunatus speluncae TaxID=2594267 RepID=UPI001266554B|nr:VOC family protein [Microlunatus speluncae]